MCVCAGFYQTPNTRNTPPLNPSPATHTPTGCISDCTPLGGVLATHPDADLAEVLVLAVHDAGGLESGDLQVGCVGCVCVGCACVCVCVRGWGESKLAGCGSVGCCSLTYQALSLNPTTPSTHHPQTPPPP